MYCSRENIGAMDMDELVTEISAIYSNHDKRRSIWDVWSHALHHAAAVAEEVRKRCDSAGNEDKLKQEIADLTLWFFTMLNKLRGDIGDPTPGVPAPDSLVRISARPSRLMWNRYPGSCPWCNSVRCCECDALNIPARPKVKSEIRERAQSMRQRAEQSSEKMPNSTDKWQDFVSAIYGERLNKLSLTAVALHLLEEMGEVSDGLIRMYTYSESVPAPEIQARQIRLENELADTFSWILGLVERLRTECGSTERMLLSKILWQYYGEDKQRCLVCRFCRQAVCACSVRLISTVEEVSKIRESLRSTNPH